MKVDEDFTDTPEGSKEDTKGFKPYKIILPLICLALSVVIVYFTVGIYKKTDSGSGFSKSYSAESSGKREMGNAEKDEEPKESEDESSESSTAVPDDDIPSEPTVAESQSSATATSSQTTASKSSPKANNTAVVNINTAGKEELMTLYGIGETKAQRIIDYRNSYGSFQSIEQITAVSGIGEKTFLKNKDRLTVG